MAKVVPRQPLWPVVLGVFGSLVAMLGGEVMHSLIFITSATTLLLLNVFAHLWFTRRSS